MKLDKNIYFRDNLVSTVTFNPANKFTFQAVGTTTVNSLTGAPTVSNVFIYTATETDPTTILQLVSTVTKGESALLRLLFCQKYSIATGTATPSHQQRINSSFGSTLLRTYFGGFNGTERNATVNTHNDSFLLDYNTWSVLKILSLLNRILSVLLLKLYCKKYTPRHIQTLA